jgi:hypothetical protein
VSERAKDVVVAQLRGHAGDSLPSLVGAVGAKPRGVPQVSPWGSNAWLRTAGTAKTVGIGSREFVYRRGLDGRQGRFQRRLGDGATVRFGSQSPHALDDVTERQRFRLEGRVEARDLIGVQPHDSIAELNGVAGGYLRRCIDGTPVHQNGSHVRERMDPDGGRGREHLGVARGNRAILGGKREVDGCASAQDLGLPLRESQLQTRSWSFLDEEEQSHDAVF